MSEIKENAIMMIPKAEAAFLKDDKSFAEHISNTLTRELANRVMNVLEAEGEIILKKPVLKVSEYLPTNSVEYLKQLVWSPFVRCKECKYHEDGEPGMVWCPHIVGNWVNDEWFCAEGKR